ncbi:MULTISPECIES: deoxyribodipyrimidine photo-lyase [unclassified Tatumella]|uniref:deoxyribodipyrimidine photo-lyase n=1 Tax=unclassified Tatumella TaxID=2649542 RepID=UPI001BAF8042|nr:deoxyribodipyrimidine photo-lyase [Tatumella sp. JGM16]MBS0911312.1 deoxyribodipyrimidine photo-lyase [Tatumella sp. JGM91]
MKTHIVWLRADLRLHDNPALYAACQDPQARVIALYIATPGQWQQHDVSGRQLEFIRDGLKLLSEELSALRIPLLYASADSFTDSVSCLTTLCIKHQATQLFYNYQYELNEQRRDRLAEQQLSASGIICEGFHDGTLLPPGSVLTGKGTMYNVYTPFSKALLKVLNTELPECYPSPAVREYPADLAGDEIPCLSPDSQQYDRKLFPPGHRAALQRLRSFSQDKIRDYHRLRDFPEQPATSGLSPYLATGQISARQCLRRIVHDHPRALSGGDEGSWLNEIFWREFYRHLLVAYPQLCRHQPFTDWTRNIRWQQNDVQFTAWQQGSTGFPIVDAAMRQLQETGWMHNRLRMIVASFLVKDLLIDWRQGERYFMSQLLDGDLAANNGGWQWAASTGTDAAPYFRIFNPRLQGERFDPQGDFIRRWLPELAGIPGKAIHDPHEWAKKNRVTLAYPLPIVDHKQARQTTLQAFETARKGGNSVQE